MTDWFRVSDLYVEGEPIWLKITGQDKAWLGYAKFTPAQSLRLRIGSPGDCEPLPKCATVDAWRPRNLETWPDELPEPMRLQHDVEFERPPEPQSAPEAPEADYGWPHPHVRLGKPHEAPQSVEECEARILRFLRTQEVMEREVRKVEQSWPPELRQAAHLVEKQLRSARTRRLAFLRPEDYADFEEDFTEVAPRPARWEPLPRDVWEWETGIPLTWAPNKSDRKLFKWRAARPPYSFRQISELLRIPEDVVKRDYEHQCERAFKRATERVRDE